MELETKQSRVTIAPDCSVIQGSKLSGLLYILYTNEVPRLQKLIENKEWKRENITNEDNNFKVVSHETINYIDNSNSVIKMEDPEQTEKYINEFFKVLQYFYFVMKLKINPDKTNIMIICRPNKDKHRNIKLKTITEEIMPKKQIKVLGWTINERLSMDTHANNVLRNINHGLSKVTTISKYMSQKQELSMQTAICLV